MEFYQLKSFVTVARTANITKAAKVLHTTPPSVSNHIRQMEAHLGVRLFTRTPKGMQITSQGSLLCRKAEAILYSVEEMTRIAGSMKERVSGAITMGINTSSDFLKIESLVSMILERHPGLRLEVVPSSSHRIIENILDHTMDCGFAFGPAPAWGIRSLPLTSVDLVIAIPAVFKDPYQTAPLESLAALPWVVPENGCPLLAEVTDLLFAGGVTLQNKIFANDDITKRALVRKGAAVCVLEHYDALPLIEKEVMVPWKGGRRFVSPLWFVYGSDHSEDLLIRTMVSLIEELWSG